MKIALCSSEVFPFVKTGGLADVCGTLPLALKAIGHHVVIFLPKYKFINTGDFYEIKRSAKDVWTSSLGSAIEVYFIEYDDYFNRDGVYGEKDKDYPDNLERFQFFCQKTLEFIKERAIKLDIIHCHDWQTALIPVYLKEKYASLNFKSVLTIHNLAFQGVFEKEQFDVLKLDKFLFNARCLEFYGKINLLKGGIIYADFLTTVSPRYAKEIQTKVFGCGLEGVIRDRGNSLQGILNGVDYENWDPQSDVWIVKNYSVDNVLDGKLENKRYVQEAFGLDVDPAIPLFGFVGRLADQKGVDLLLEFLSHFKKMEGQFILQGSGDKKYMERLKNLNEACAKKIGVHFQYDERMAHLIYAGADLFLMPSVFEPCGLTQLISLRYGTVPIVFETGGLADTIEEFDERSGQGNGFLFREYTLHKFTEAVQKAVGIFHHTEYFKRLRINAMNSDFSWEASAREYEKVYQCVL